jgi:hypothetical protein
MLEILTLASAVAIVLALRRIEAAIHHVARLLTPPASVPADEEAEEEWDPPERDIEREIEALASSARDPILYRAHLSYLHDLAQEAWDREYARWTFEHPAAAVSLNDAEDEMDAAVDERTDLSDDERERLRARLGEEQLAVWKGEYPAASATRDALWERAYLDVHRFKAVAAMPEVVKARKAARALERSAATAAAGTATNRGDQGQP